MENSQSAAAARTKSMMMEEESVLIEDLDNLPRKPKSQKQETQVIREQQK